MHEQYLDETQVAQALAVLNAGAALVLRNSMTFPESYQSVLAAQLALPQADAVNAKADVRVDYLAHLCERIGTTDMDLRWSRRWRASPTWTLSATSWRAS
jgi:hypothetical protein